MSPLLRARNAVALTFSLNGFCFASLVTRIPDLRADLSLDNGALGLLLLAIAAGSVLSLPSSGRLIEWSSPGTVVRLGGWFAATGMLLAAVGVAFATSVPVTAVGLFCYGIGTGLWDVAMNVEGAEVEHRLARTIMPRFHAGWSAGSIVGAGVGVPMAALDAPLLLHIGGAGAASLAVLLVVSRAFLAAAPAPAATAVPRSAWREPRTLAIGLMVLSFAVVEGSANDWLTLALIDGYDARHWVGVVGFAVFVVAMTTGRMAGPFVLDRFGRAPVLWGTAATAAVGILLVVLGGSPAIAGLGIVLWGLGAALGFPVGMSAAADDPARAAARVSVVSTIGYAAFLAGPPLLGELGDRVGTLRSLLAVTALLAVAGVSLLAIRERETPSGVSPAEGSPAPQ